MIQKFLKILHKIYSYIPAQKHSLKDTTFEKSFTVIITSFNNENYCEKNLESVLQQNYSNFKVIYIDDVSTDSTLEKVKNYIKHHDVNKKITLISNKKRNLKLKNLYQTIHTLDNKEIIIELDGDDYLAHPNVLKIINQIYHHTDTQITYTNYQNNPPDIAEKLELKNFSQQTPFLVKKLTLFRKYPWIYSGLRTYYAHLFKRIPKDALICPFEPYKNMFYPVSHDLAMMYPMLELCAGKIAYIKEPLLIRNIDSSFNDFKLYEEDIRKKINNHIRSKNVF